MSTPTTDGPSAAEFKSCCAAAYDTDWMSLLLGDSFHPGGLDLTRHVASHLGLQPGDALLDVASGRGTSALALAAGGPVRVCGVDLAPANITRACEAAETAGLGDRVEFRLGDAEALPVGDGEFDAVLCECALCTFPDQATAIAEMYRALRPGGRVGISDVTADLSNLPPRLRTWAARVACIGAAGRAESYVDLLRAGGFAVRLVEAHDEVLAAMVDRIEARLLVVGMLARSGAAPDLDRDEAASVIAEVREAIAEGHLGYVVIVGQKSPGTGMRATRRTATDPR